MSLAKERHRMGVNEVNALNDYYADWLKTRFSGSIKANPFEFFCAEQFLKDFLLDDSEVLSGLIGDGDGGVDAFYFFINHVIVDDDTVVDRRSENDIDVLIMQVKENKGFSPTSIDKLDRFSDDLFDLKRTKDEYRYNYNDKLSHLMELFKTKMKNMGEATVAIEYYYVTRCDEPPDENAIRSEKQLHTTANKYFRHVTVKPFNYAGALELYDQTLVRPPTKKSLHFEKSIDSKEGWVGWVTLKTFYEFLKDENHPHKLNERIFDDNVRGYYQSTAINRAITATLTNNDEPEFWLLNNGITILTPRASLSGDLDIRDPQIVNGLQTSRRLFDYFSSGVQLPDKDTRRILIRVIQNQDPEVRDEIIRATNNQNKMPPEALISTSRLHKQLDSYFANNGLFYDRRKGFYRDQGKPIGQIISILFLVQSVVAIMLKRPNDARGRPRDYVTKDRGRWLVFGYDDYQQPAQQDLLTKYRPFDREVYLRCVKILRKVDSFLETNVRDNIERRNTRFYLARYVSCEVTGNAHCPPAALLTADLDAISDAKFTLALDEIRMLYTKHGANDDAAKGKEMIVELDAVLTSKFSPPHAVKADKA